jgi:hypothetical protein
MRDEPLQATGFVSDEQLGATGFMSDEQLRTTALHCRHDQEVDRSGFWNGS